MHFPAFSHFPILLLVNDLTSPPAAPAGTLLSRSFSNGRTGSRKSIACPLEKPPTTIPDSEISRSEACRDLTLRNADNTLEMRGSGDRKMRSQCGFLFGRTSDFGDRRAFLRSSSERKKREGGKQRPEWSQ